MQIFLGIVGDDLDPAMITATLGGKPHEAGRRGDPIVATTARGRTISRPAIAGYWQRTVLVDARETADSAVRDLFSGLSGDAVAWQSLASRFRTGVTVHQTPPRSTPEAIFSPAMLAFLQHRSLQVHLNED